MGEAEQIETGRDFKVVEVIPGDTRRDGRLVSYRLAGEGPTRTVWIAGTNVDSRFWDMAQTAEFAQRGTCLLVDGAGTGRTDPLPDGQWSAESMAQDVLAAMDAVAWADAHIIGHSLGAAIAAELAWLSPGRARSISLHAGWTSADKFEHVRAWFEARRATALSGDSGLASAYAFFLVSPHYLQRFGRTRGALPHLQTQVGSPPLSTKLGHYQADLDYSGEGRLEQIAVPTLVTAAEDDQAIPAFASRNVAARIKRAEFTILKIVGHLAPLEDPQQFNHVQAQFIERVDRALRADPPFPDPVT